MVEIYKSLIKLQLQYAKNSIRKNSIEFDFLISGPYLIDRKICFRKGN